MNGIAGKLAHSCRHAIREALSAIQHTWTCRFLAPPALALHWLRKQEVPSGGLRAHSRCENAYAEITGYLIPTLLDYGEIAYSERLLKWLLSIQGADGSYPDSATGLPHAFDSGQVLRGLLAGLAIHGGARNAAVRTADYLCSQVQRGSGFVRQYQGEVPETVLLYVLPALREASRVLDRPDYEEAVQTCLAAYQAHAELLRPDDLTHFLCYEIEALIDLGYPDRTRAILDTLRSLQSPDGAVRGRGNTRWVCVPGLAQLAVCWYKTGMDEPADRALTWLEKHQQTDGGWRGSYGKGADYFRHEALPWAAKYYLDAHRLRIVSFFRRNASLFPDSVDPSDGRLHAILDLMHGDESILDAGCGKGRFLRSILARYPGARAVGVDPSPELLVNLPPTAERREGWIERLPLKESTFDITFSIEVLEHSANIEAGIREMVRVTRPGGRIVIVDKHHGAWGRLECPPWERWPSKALVTGIMSSCCDDVTVRDIACGPDSRPNGLMVAWTGRRKSIPF